MTAQSATGASPAAGDDPNAHGTRIASPSTTTRAAVALEERPPAPSGVLAMWSVKLRDHMPGTFTAACLKAINARVTDPTVRQDPANHPLRAVAGADVADRRPATATTTAGDVALRVLDAFKRSERRAEALRAARRMGTASLPLLRRFLILALVAVVAVIPLATIGATTLRTAVHAVVPEPHNGVQAAWAASAARAEASVPDPGRLRVHVQTQAFLPAGGERQFRLAVDRGEGPDGSLDASAVTPSLQVDLAIHPQRSGEGSVSVTPTRLVVSRTELISAPIWIQVADDVPCGSDLGELRVRVRELGSDGAQGTTTVALPPVDCGAVTAAVSEHR